MLLVACRMRLAACICGLYYGPNLQELQGYAYAEAAGAARLPIHRLIMYKSRTATHTQINLFRTKFARAASYTFTEI